MIITNSRYRLVCYFITSYPTRAHGIIVIYKCWNSIFNNAFYFQRLQKQQKLQVQATKLLTHQVPRSRGKLNLKRYKVKWCVCRFSVKQIFHVRAPEKMNTCSGPGAHYFHWTKPIRGMPVHRGLALRLTFNEAVVMDTQRIMCLEI